jgi:hypothetical protein
MFWIARESPLDVHGIDEIRCQSMHVQVRSSGASRIATESYSGTLCHEFPFSEANAACQKMQILILGTVLIFDAYNVELRIIESTGASPSIAMPIYDAND